MRYRIYKYKLTFLLMTGIGFLVISICCFSEPYLDSFLLHSSYILTKHIVQPLDLMSVDLCDGGRVYGFLGVAWAIVSDVDIESEKFRALGSLRFTITGISKIMSKCNA